MTLSEFKAWFEGFSEGIDTAPTAEQFAKIKAKVAKIDGAPTTERIFIDRWWPAYRPHQWWESPIIASPVYPSWTATSTAAGLSEVSVSAGDGYQHIPPGVKGETQTKVFDIFEAMRDLGRQEAAA